MLFSSIAAFIAVAAQISNFVTARFCEGGHICSLPRECCTQGCCPPFQGGTRQLSSTSTDPLSKLFFIGHWFFWCVVVAVVLAALCAYSLWKKRHSVCGWGLNEPQTQSEGGDSAGSCYAPPHYSRCNSFLHPPPPYTEVTSKPDLYPLVYSCNGESGKTSSNYLMVQYFRNYILRPAGSLSAASTVDSLSSSFIFNINEANNLVPPPYSRATSPEIDFGPLFQQQYVMPRSASQLVCHNIANNAINVGHIYEINCSSIIDGRQYCDHAGTLTEITIEATPTEQMSESNLNNSVDISVNTEDYNGNCEMDNSTVVLHNEVENENERNNDDAHCINRSNEIRQALPKNIRFGQSQSDQHFHYVGNSNRSISDIFINNNCSVSIDVIGDNNNKILVGDSGGTLISDKNSNEIHKSRQKLLNKDNHFTPNKNNKNSYRDDENIKFSHVQRVGSNPGPIQFTKSKGSPDNIPQTLHEYATYQSNQSTNGISITVPLRNKNELDELELLRSSLETCCQILQQKQQQKESNEIKCQDFSLLTVNNESKKYIDGNLTQKYLTSTTCSGVSSVANIDTLGSPPQAISPTMNVKEILNQIHVLQGDVYKCDEGFFVKSPGYKLQLKTQTTTAATSTTRDEILSSPTTLDTNYKLQHISSMSGSYTLHETTTKAHISPISTTTTATITLTPSSSNVTSAQNTGTLSKDVICQKSTANTITNTRSKRPSNFQQTQQQNKKRFYLLKPSSKTSNLIATANRYILKSPVSSVVASTNFFTNRSYSRPTHMRKGFVSRSAPTTPATPVPSNYLDDDSPLLYYQEEDDQENEHGRTE